MGEWTEICSSQVQYQQSPEVIALVAALGLSPLPIHTDTFIGNSWDLPHLPSLPSPWQLHVPPQSGQLTVFRVCSLQQKHCHHSCSADTERLKLSSKSRPTLPMQSFCSLALAALKSGILCRVVRSPERSVQGSPLHLAERGPGFAPSSCECSSLLRAAEESGWVFTHNVTRAKDLSDLLSFSQVWLLLRTKPEIFYSTAQRAGDLLAQHILGDKMLIHLTARRIYLCTRSN